MEELPELILFSGNWEDYLEEVYQIYLETIATGGLTLEGRRIKCRYSPASRGKGFSFWHIIQEGMTDDDRITDLRRCERIRWISWVIKKAGYDSRISWWDEERGAKKDRLLWIEEEDYLVVLEKRKRYWLLKTAYLTFKSHKKSSLLKSRAFFEAGKKS